MIEKTKILTLPGFEQTIKVKYEKNTKVWQPNSSQEQSLNMCRESTLHCNALPFD